MEQAEHCVDLAGACPVLAHHKRVQDLVAQAVGQERPDQALVMMRGGNLSGDLGDTIHDALIEPIQNHAEPVWSGLIPGSEDDYPVTVSHYCGIYWVQAQEYDPVGYFLDLDYAIGYVMTNWESVREVKVKRRPRK